ncbi:hypothetical protein PsorP6_005685 [Peronosclerospora sorghi]|uniref:Uncharacterized protein n=1 Tax=Peronosclerospora sorghi TaxID=230839 RepID=A0ACC0W161_9STRA|nr:hypothetical protein PsorP6_005685 [Peronosclerospora sorghi]
MNKYILLATVAALALENRCAESMQTDGKASDESALTLVHNIQPDDVGERKLRVSDTATGASAEERAVVTMPIRFKAHTALPSNLLGARAKAFKQRAALKKDVDRRYFPTDTFKPQDTTRHRDRFRNSKRLADTSHPTTTLELADTPTSRADVVKDLRNRLTTAGKVNENKVNANFDKLASHTNLDIVAPHLDDHKSRFWMAFGDEYFNQLGFGENTFSKLATETDVELLRSKELFKQLGVVDFKRLDGKIKWLKEREPRNLNDNQRLKMALGSEILLATEKLVPLKKRVDFRQGFPSPN